MILEVQRSARSEARKEELRKQELEVIWKYLSLSVILNPCVYFIWSNEISTVLSRGSHAPKKIFLDGILEMSLDMSSWVLHIFLSVLFYLVMVSYTCTHWP